jgi:hypothetical protein
MGNRNSGRKKNEKVIAQNLAILLDEIDPVYERKRMMNVLHKLVEQSEEGDMTAMKELFDRLEGKVTQTTQNETKITGKLELVKRLEG